MTIIIHKLTLKHDSPRVASRYWTVSVKIRWTNSDTAGVPSTIRQPKRGREGESPGVGSNSVSGLSLVHWYVIVGLRLRRSVPETAQVRTYNTSQLWTSVMSHGDCDGWTCVCVCVCVWWAGWTWRCVCACMCTCEGRVEWGQRDKYTWTQTTPKTHMIHIDDSIVC